MSEEQKVDAWMPLWIGAYMADTMTLTTQQHGAYLLLLFAYWRNRGPLDDDDEDLAAITKASAPEWKKLRAKLSKFFVVADGKWTHGRADKELTTAGLRKAAAASKAKAAAEARWGKSSKHAPSINQALPKDCPTPSPIPSTQNMGAEDGGESVSPARAFEEPNTEGQEPTTAGLTWRALREAGVADGDPGHPDLQRLLDAGVTPAEIASTGSELAKKGKGRFALVLATIEGRMRDAAAAAAIPPAPEVPDAGALAVEKTRREQAEFAALPATKPPESIKALLQRTKVLA